MKNTKIKRFASTSRLVGILPLGLKLERMTTQAQYQEVRELRRGTYGKRYPYLEFPERPDATDINESAVVLMVRDSVSQKLYGTMRLRHSGNGLETAGLPEEVFPPHVQAQGVFMTMDRFAIEAPPAKRLLVRLALFSAVIRLTRKLNIPWMNCVARDELAHIYKNLGFSAPATPHRFVHPAYFNVEHELYQTRIRGMTSRASLPFIRYLIWRFALPMPIKKFAPLNLGGPGFNHDLQPSAEVCESPQLMQPT